MTLPETSAELYTGLATRLAADDPSALRELFDETHEALLRFGQRFLDVASAHDAVQEAFVRVWERRHTLAVDQSVRALLFTTVRNLAFNAKRDAGTRERLLAQHGTDRLAGHQPVRPDVFVQEQELSAQLQQCIDALPERQREALMLSRFSGLRHDEIARVMGISERTVNNHLVRALDALRAHLTERGVLHHD